MVIAYFTPATGIGGGIIIGLSAAILLLVSGNIFAASCISSSTILAPYKALTDPSTAWKLLFLSSFLIISNTVLGPHFSYDERSVEDPRIPIVSMYGYLLSGFFTGFGTRLGNGCTSGHGICGMARLSKRSIVAVVIFMGTAWGTVTLTAPGVSFDSNTAFLRTEKVPKIFYNRWLGFGVSIFFVVLTLCALYNLWRTKKQNLHEGIKLPRHQGGETTSQVDKVQSFEDNNQMTLPQQQEAEDDDVHTVTNDSIHKLIPAGIAGSIFAVSLAVSQMVLQSKVFGFLNLYLFADEGGFDPTLLTVMVGGYIISFISYQFVKPFGFFPNNPYARESPIMASKFDIPTSKVIDAHLIGGAFFFGVGLGISGLCPGPAIFLAACGSEPILYYWWPTFIFGSFLAQRIKACLDSSDPKL